jgi:hypothetical protein
MNGCVEAVGERPLSSPTLTSYGMLPVINIHTLLDCDVAMTALRDPVLSHKRFGHLNMHSLHAQHANGVPTSPLMPSSSLFLVACVY